MCKLYQKKSGLSSNGDSTHQCRAIVILLFYLAVLCIPLTAKGDQENGGSGSSAAADNLLFVINYPYQIWSDDFTQIHLCLFKPDFKPARGAVVKVNGQQVGKTDANGVCLFAYKPGSDASHLLEAELKENNKKYTMRKRFASNSRTESFRADRLYVYTDRGVYNPGQEILVRLVAWQLKKEYFPVSAADVQLLLQDKDGKLFYGENLTTNDYGIAAATIPLAAHMPEGDYELAVLYQQTRETASLRVERFIPPVINIKHDLKRYLTDAQPLLSAKVELSYFTGGSPLSASLLLEVSFGAATILSKRFTADGAGVTVGLTRQELAALRSRLTGESWFKIKLAVTDNYQQQAGVVWDMFYTARPFTAVLELDKDAYPAGEQVQVLAKITDPDGQPATGLGVILEIGDTGGTVTGTTDRQGVAVLEFPMPARAVTVVLKSPGVTRPLAERSIPFQTAKPLISKVTGKPETAGTAITLTARFAESYLPVEEVVHADFTDISGAIVYAATLPVLREGGSYLARGEITAPTWGTMLVNLYCCAIEKQHQGRPLRPELVGFLTEGQHVTFYADKNLEIRLHNFAQAAGPGENLRFRIETTGGTGEKSLGVSLVDEAVLSLLNPFLKNPVQHFYNPQVKVISTGGAGVLTWPVVDRSWGEPRYDIAYSDWGWKAPGSAADDSERMSAMDATDTDFETTGMADEFMSEEAEAPLPPQAKEKKEMALSEPSPTTGDKLSQPATGETGATRQAAGTTAEQEPAIVIRTAFPETALWEPLLVTTGNSAGIELQLPDSMTSQQLTVLATDKSGHIGFLQQGITVSQPLYIRSLLPAALTRGDSLEVSTLVRNNTASTIEAVVCLEAERLQITGSKQTVTVPALGSRLVSWQVKANQAGAAEFRVTASAAGKADTEVRQLTVLPAGPPQTGQVTGTAASRSSFYREFDLPQAAGYASAVLNLSLPGILPAFQGLQVFDSYFHFSPWQSASVILMNLAMLEYAGVYQVPPEYADTLRAAIKRAIAALLQSQLPSGGWGWYADSERPPNLYYTVCCLRALTAAAGADFFVGDAVIRDAVRYILDHRDKNGLWSSQGAWFWEVFNEDTDQALSAEIFEVLMAAFLRLNQERSAFAQTAEQLAGKIMAILEQGTTEPMTLAAGLLGMNLYRQSYSGRFSRQELEAILQRLLSLKRTGYWEPHWYHAYGGMVELNARIIDVLVDLNPAGSPLILREIVTWLLASRTAWGTWHNEAGTAAAVRALLKAASLGSLTPGTEVPAELAITVNNRQVARIAVDPADPFLSAARLRYFEITPWLQPGKNSVSVTYSGNLQAAVLLEIKRWQPVTSVIPAAGKVTVRRKAPAIITTSQPAVVTIELNSADSLPLLMIEEHVPSNAAADIASLELLRQQGLITGYRLQDNTLNFMLAGGKSALSLSYKITGVIKGTAYHPGLQVTNPASGELLGSVVSAELVVK